MPRNDLIDRIHTATQPTISLDANYDSSSSFRLIQTMSDPDGDRTIDVDTEETIEKLMEILRPREQEVLALRFGLGGRERLSLTQVGRILEVSKERVRQIEERALKKLRASAPRAANFGRTPGDRNLKLVPLHRQRIVSAWSFRTSIKPGPFN